MSKYKLILENIGQFHRSSFDLDEVTLFYGANETGKTTIIDGIMNSMISTNKKKFIPTHILQPRYGDEISTKLKITATNEEIKEVDHDVVKNLLMVRASRLDLDFVNNRTEATWVAEVRDGLFTGGVNPDMIVSSISEMERKTKTSKSPLYEVKALDEAIGDDKMILESKKRQISTYAESVKKQEKLKSDESKHLAELKLVNTELNRKIEVLAKYKEVHNRDTIKALQAKISDANKLKEKIEKSVDLSDDRYSKIKQLEGQIKNFLSQKEIIKKDLEQKQKNLAAESSSFEKESSLLEKFKQGHDLAKLTQNKLEVQVSESVVVKAEKPVGILIAGAVLLLSGLVALGLLPAPGSYVGFLLVAIGVILLAKPFIMPSAQPMAKESPQLDLKAAVKTFNQQYKDGPPCPDTNFSAANDYLRIVIEKFVQARSASEGLKEKIVTLDKEVLRLKKTLGELEENLKEAENNLRKSTPVGTKDSEEYFKVLQEKKNDELRLQKLNDELSREVVKQGVRDREELIQYVEHKIIEIVNRPSGPQQPISQLNLQVLEKEVLELQAKKEKLAQVLEATGRDLTRTSTEIQIKVDQLSKDVVSCEKRIFQKEREKEKKLLEMDSLRLLKSIVQEIAVDSSQKFAVLGDGINKYMKIILGNERDITFYNLESLEDIQCVDRFGQKRNVTQLSSGTMDAFIFAARLALLEKLHLSSDSFLIMDDPFVHLDVERLEKSIQALKEFHEEHPLPIVFFTKDEHTKDLFCSVFGIKNVIELMKPYFPRGMEPGEIRVS
jgi:DNA sulfur modification protein DndD